MPIYEYRCKPCDQTFEVLIRSEADVPHCPECGTIDLVKQFSVPAAAHSGSGGSSALPICGEAGADSFGCGPGHCKTGMCSFD
jgi:putative FmdB family regulatory protein